MVVVWSFDEITEVTIAKITAQRLTVGQPEETVARRIVPKKSCDPPHDPKVSATTAYLQQTCWID
jgi:hypothetical protein